MNSAVFPKSVASQKITAIKATPNSAAMAYSLLQMASERGVLMLAVVQDSYAAQLLEHDLKAFKPDFPVLHFPDWETLAYDRFSPHPDLVSQRIECLYRLPGCHQGVLVVPVTSLMQRIAPAEWIAGQVLNLSVGQKFNLADERMRLQQFGYRLVSNVMDAGDFSVRGAIIDIFPAGSAMPIRIELLDDEIDSLRLFDPESQRSEGAQKSFKLLPAREFSLDSDHCKSVREKLLERFDINPRTCSLYADLKENVAPAGIEYYLPLFFEKTGNLLDYMPKNFELVLASKSLASAETFWQQVGQRLSLIHI